MNDLAEKALHGADVARRAVAARPVAALSLLGFVIAATVVFTGGRVGASTAAVPISSWFGLLPSAAYQVLGVGMSSAMFGAVIALIGAWLLTIRVSHRRRFAPRQVAMIAIAWAVPFAVGPPLLSTDVYGYVARGLLARNGLDPYEHGATALGSQRIVDAIDPAQRSARSTDGPLTELLGHLAVSVSGGQAVGALVAVRVIAAASVVVIGWLAAQLAGERAAAALCLTVLNPAVLLYVLSAAQLTGVLVALVLAALLFAAQQRWAAAVIVICLAAGVKPVAILALPAVLAVHALGHPVRFVVRIAARDAVLAAVALTGVVLCVPNGLGWIGNLSDAIHEHTPFAPSSIASKALGWIVSPATFDDLSTGGRIAAAAAALTVVGYLYATVASRPLDRTIAYGLLTAGLLAPVIYPSYLMWGALTLAVTALGARQDWVIGLSCVACVLAPVGFGERVAVYVTTAALSAIAVVLLPRLSVRHHNELVTGSRVGAGN